MAEIREIRKPVGSKVERLKTEFKNNPNFMENRLLAHRERLEQLRQTREQARLLAAEQIGEKSDTQIHWESLDEKTKAARRLGDFPRAQAKYKEEIAKPKGLIKAVKNERSSKITVARTFFGGIMEDWRKKRLDKKEVVPAGTTVKIRIISREEIIDDPQIREFWGNEENQTALANLFGKEIFREINCTNIMMIEGVTPGQFRQLIRKLGGNPLALASDRRGNNEGAIAIDNKADSSKKHPFYEKIKDKSWFQEEMKYWKKVLPGLKLRVSRTHSLIYGVKDSTGKESLLLPVHVDPKNWVAGPSASKFHQVESLSGPEYVGTGEYDLAIALMIELLREAKVNGLIKLYVKGMEKLRTTGSIVGDNLITEAIANRVRASLG